MPNNSLFMLFKSWAPENVTDLHYSIAAGIINNYFSI